MISITYQLGRSNWFLQVCCFSALQQIIFLINLLDRIVLTNTKLTSRWLICANVMLRGLWGPLLLADCRFSWIVQVKIQVNKCPFFPMSILPQNWLLCWGMACGRLVYGGNGLLCGEMDLGEMDNSRSNIKLLEEA